jgi:xylulokinase
MSNEPCLLGLDIGGSAVKVGLFARDGRLLALHQTTIAPRAPHPGWAEVEPRLWWEALCVGCREVVAASGIAAAQIHAIGLSNMIGTVTPLDAAGQPMRPALMYHDTRSAAEATWMLDRVPELPLLTANRVQPGNTSLTSILWLRRHEPETVAATATYATTNTLLFRWLTGETRVDWTNANFMGLYDFRRHSWSEDLASRLGFPLASLPPLGAPHDAAPLLPGAASELGLQAGTPVALGGVDGAMSSLGVGAIEVGDAYDVSGTSEMIAVCLPAPVVCPQLLGRWHVLPGLWTMIGAMSTTGAAWQWLRDVAYGVPSARDAQGRYETMTEEAAASPAGANGVLFLPHMMGERAPHWDPYARGVFFGLSLSSQRGDLARAVLEGVAYAMRQIVEIITVQSGVPIRRVVFVGGGTRNLTALQIKADVWGLELQLMPTREASALGAALTAGVAAGIYADYAEAVRCAVPVGGSVISPQPDQRAAYEHSYRVFRQLYPALAPAMHLAATGARP